jgi:UDP-glucose 4-epimerase
MDLLAGQEQDGVTRPLTGRTRARSRDAGWRCCVDRGGIYPARPESRYSLGKHVEEQIAKQLCRWPPDLKMIGLRFSNVMYPEDYAQFPSFDADVMLRKWNLWAYIDARDGDQAIRRALEHEAPGMDRFIIANAETVMTRPSAELAREVFPGVEVRKELGANETMLSIDKARAVLSYEPEFSWRDEV